MLISGMPDINAFYQTIYYLLGDAFSPVFFYYPDCPQLNAARMRQQSSEPDDLFVFLCHNELFRAGVVGIKVVFEGDGINFLHI